MPRAGAGGPNNLTPPPDACLVKGADQHLRAQPNGRTGAALANVENEAA